MAMTTAQNWVAESARKNGGCGKPIRTSPRDAVRSETGGRICGIHGYCTACVAGRDAALAERQSLTTVLRGSNGRGSYGGQDTLAEALAKEWGERIKGYSNRGGYIYRSGGKTQTGFRGWRAVWTANRREILDDLTRSLTSFRCFEDLLDARGSYRPTISASRNWRYFALAVAYDRAQSLRKDPRRAYRS